jgi:hypothetical protein
MSDNITLPREVAYEVPLHELLESVPSDARLVIDYADGKGTRFIPVGRLCREAATALRTALAAPDETEALRRNDARYRWLRGEHSRIDPCIKANAKYKLERQSSTWVEIHDLDAIIDAAMQKGDKT